MGTNFYLMSKNKDFVDKYFPEEYEVVNSPYLGYQIHISKRSCGWKPLFQFHNKAYSSVEEMKTFIKTNENELEIYDEYGEEFSLEQLQDELIDWEKHQAIKYMKYIPEGVPDKLFGGKQYLIEGTKDDYDITIPYDHVEYDKLDPYSEKSWRDVRREPMYFKDNDGYDFTKGDFS